MVERVEGRIAASKSASFRGGFKTASFSIIILGLKQINIGLGVISS